MARQVDIDDGSIGDAGNPVGGGSSGTENPSIIGKNLRDSNNVSIRPTNLSSAHLYNLRNQSWALPRLTWDGDDNAIQDPISTFKSIANKWPSNADSVNYSLYPNTGSDDDKTMDRFNAKDLVNNPAGNSLSSFGHYIIDVMERGKSRIAATVQEKVQYPTLSLSVSSLPVDSTPGGPSLACEYSGRVFYAGFSGEIIDGDANSPRLSSYVLFSQLVTDTSSIGNCYQQADPTNKDENDLVDTDGGFIRFEGAYQITGLINIGSNLAVIANNGVWLLTGGNNSGFKATDYQTNKITNNGCISPGSIVVVDNTFYYWGSDGIYYVSPNQFGDYQSQNITEKTIQKYYADIPALDVRRCEGVFDSYEKKIKWIYGNTISANTSCKELVLDLSLGAFYPSKLNSLGSGLYPKAVKGIQTEPFTNSTSLDSVVVSGDTVLADSDPVVITNTNATASVKEVRYLILLGTNSSGKILYSFGSYRDVGHRDWRTVDGTGIDAPAFLLTGTFAGNDTSRKKTVPYVTVHMRKTETGFTVDSNSDWVPADASSCIMQAQWNWTDNISSGQWSREVEVYRHKRHYMPSDLGSYEDGYYVVESKNKLRGSGRVVSLLFRTNPNYHCELLGWSMPVETSTDV